MSAALAVGVDLGATKTVIVQQDAGLVLTETGGISRPSLVCFANGARLFGEEAAAQSASDGCIGVNFDVVGRSLEACSTHPLSKHRKARLTATSSGRPAVSVSIGDEQVDVDVAAVLGMFLAEQDRRIQDVVASAADAPKLCIVAPPDSPSDVARTIREAAAIAGIAAERVFVVSKQDAMVTTYGRKLQGLRPVEVQNLKEKKVLMVEMGAAHTTAVLLSISGADEPTPQVLSYQHDSELGAMSFDLALFAHFASEIVVAKYKGEPVTPGSKRGQRLLSGCERLRKLLSQLGEGSVTVENMIDSGDIQLSLKRDELSRLCEPLLARFRQLLLDVLAKTQSGAVAVSDVSAVEVLGGGVRMQVVQQVLGQIFGAEMPLGAKFDDASVALGAAIFVNAQTEAQNTSGSGSGDESGHSSAFPALSEAELAALHAQELVYQQRDADIAKVLAVRNALEAFVLDMRGAPRRRFGESIDAGKLNALLDDAENWLWDNQEAGLADLEQKNAALRESVGALCAQYLAAVERERVEVEKKLEQDAAAAAAERAAEGGGDVDDHDNRKLRYADRMRLAVKNKDEGTELFKGAVSVQQFRTAAARYSKSLTHCMKFFDTTPEQQKEVNAMKVTLYLNLASCYLKLENPDSALNNCNHALEIEPKSAKAFFRRSMAHEAKKDWDLALEDIKSAQQNLETEDKAITLAAKRIKDLKKKETEKAKGVWGKAFGAV